jgi:YidC/Oxa1 family membrane protein insertase
VSILNPLADLVAWVIVHLHAGLGSLFGPDTGLAWGLSIAILVILIRICLIPLFVKQVHAQRKMAQHAPQLQELRKKYKNDKQRLNEETMKFYKENGVNPLAGCLPMIPQMIIFFALFYVLRAIAEWKPGTAPKYGMTVALMESAQKATIFGVHLGDKILLPHTPGMGTVPTIVALITVVISASTTFLTVRQSSKRGLMQTSVDPDNPMAATQKYMMYIVPFFSLTGLYWQYGLVLYWVTTNLWTLGQQYFMFRNWTVEPAPPSKAGTAAGGLIRATRSAMRTESGPANSATGSAKPASGGAKTTTAGSARSGSARPAAGSTRPAGGGAKPAAGGTKSAGPSGTRSAAARPASGAQAGTGNGRPASGAQAGAGNGRPASGAQAGTGNGRPASGGSPRAKTGSGSGGASSASDRVRTGSASRDAAANSPGPANGQDGAARRLLRLGRKQEPPAPEPEPEVTPKVVRQQPVRQARSKRSGNSGKR